jgi:hypothetical protein
VTAALAAGALALSAGCGSDDAAGPVDSVIDPPALDSTTTSSVAPVTTISDTTSTTDATSTTTATDTTATPGETNTIEVPIPAGGFEAGPADVFVLNRDGDLELWSDALTASPGERTLVADYPDPFGVVTEGSGPNVVDHVAGVVDGSVVFGDCCEPIGGNVRVATGPDVVETIAGGYSPTLSPSGDLLGTANDFLTSQTATDGEGAGIFRMINEDQAEPYLNVADLTWSAHATVTSNDDHLVLLGWTEEGWWLYDVDRSTLELTPAVPLGVPPIPEAPDTNVGFAGHGPDGEIVVAESGPDGTRLRFFAPPTLAEMPQLERTLPGSAISVRVTADGLGLLWVDAGTLYHLPAGELEAPALAGGLIAAWPASVLS